MVLLLDTEILLQCIEYNVAWHYLYDLSAAVAADTVVEDDAEVQEFVQIVVLARGFYLD